MSTAFTTAREDQMTSAESERRCIVTGVVRPKDELIRFAISPDNTVVPDLAGNLPGRGLWVTAERDAIETAVQKNLFSKAAKAPVKADPALAATVVQLLRKRCLDLLGLAKSAGIAVLGQMQVEAAMKAKTIVLLLVADDAAANGLEKINATNAVRTFTRNELGAALGHDQIVFAGFVKHGLTEKLQSELMRLEKIAGTPHLIKETDNGNQ
jgi:predicted RNA-binding protein YlxR (DUF448 family)